MGEVLQLSDFLSRMPRKNIDPQRQNKARVSKYRPQGSQERRERRGYCTDGAELESEPYCSLISYTRFNPQDKTYQSTERTIEFGGPPLLRS